VDTERSLRRAGDDNRRKRLVVGWFSFTCCEDTTILLTELLNDRLDEWKKLIEFRHMKALKTSNSLSTSIAPPSSGTSSLPKT
jgi:hypothetical protein